MPRDVHTQEIFLTIQFFALAPFLNLLEIRVRRNLLLIALQQVEQRRLRAVAAFLCRLAELYDCLEGILQNSALMAERIKRARLH